MKSPRDTNILRPCALPGPTTHSPGIQTAQEMARQCNRCGLCQTDCDFLKNFGLPADIAEKYYTAPATSCTIAFSCSLCGLCKAICPLGLDPARMFLDMRRDSFNNGNGNFLRHKRVLNYERKGTSKRYTWQTLKNDCTTIFFPGCALPGTRPQKTLQLYSYLQSHDPDMGLVLDCCSRPSHDLGRQPCFEAAFSNLNTTLIRKGIQKVIVACPSCYEVFSQYGKGLEITTIYEYMVRQGFAVKGCLHGEVTVHDPCVIREKSDLHDAVRTLIRAHGLTICEMTHAKEKTLCCGEGGAVASIDKNLSRQWGRRRKRESMGRPILTYCAGCAAELNKSSPTYHLIDLLFEPEKTINGKVRVSRAPITYLNRLCLKKTLQRQR